MVTVGAFKLHFGVPWHLLGFILKSFGVILGASALKMWTPRHYAHIAKTYENLLILEGWRLGSRRFGSMGEGLGLAAGWLDGSWLAGCWAGCC